MDIKHKKNKAFTLIELLVGVTIFVMVSALVMATITIAMSSKAKTVALNQLRMEGGKIMNEIQDMVQKGNGTTRYNAGVVILGVAGCVNGSSTSGMHAFQTDYKNWRFQRALEYDISDPAKKKINIRKRIFDSSDNEITYSAHSIHSDQVTIEDFVISGQYDIRTGPGQCPTPVPTTISVSFTVRAATIGNTGAPTKMDFKSTFSSGYPYPSLGPDSVPPKY